MGRRPPCFASEGGGRLEEKERGRKGEGQEEREDGAVGTGAGGRGEEERAREGRSRCGCGNWRDDLVFVSFPVAAGARRSRGCQVAQETGAGCEMNGKGEGAGPVGAGGAGPPEATFTFTGIGARLVHRPTPLPPFVVSGHPSGQGTCSRAPTSDREALRSGCGGAPSSRRGEDPGERVGRREEGQGRGRRPGRPDKTKGGGE